MSNKEFKHDGIYLNGKLWRRWVIDPSFFSAFSDFVPIAKDIDRAYYKAKAPFFGDCYPYDWTDDQWIVHIINSIRCEDDISSDERMIDNPWMAFGLYRPC